MECASEDHETLRDEDRLVAKVGNAAHGSAARWLSPDVRGRPIGQQHGQPLAVWREHRLHQQPARQLRSRDASQLLRCSILWIRDQHFHVRQSIERGQIQHEVKFSVGVHRGSLTVLAHEQIGALLAKVFSMRNPFWLVGEK